jgi:predicted HicB family RNase H-like nuclease
MYIQATSESIMAKSNKLKKVMKNISRDDIEQVKKSSAFYLRMSPVDKERLEKAASSLEISLSEFLVQAGLYAAEKLDKGKKK